VNNKKCGTVVFLTYSATEIAGGKNNI